MNSLCTRKLGLVFLLIAAIGPARGAAPEDSRPYEWRQQAESLLEPSAIAQLERDGLLIMDASWKQIFQPYLSDRLPVFITSDSLLNAYHVLFAESLMQLERASARRLPEILRTVWSNLPAAEAAARGDEAVVADATHIARIVIGTALRLLGEEIPDVVPAIEALIAREVELVKMAQARSKPDWLGPPDVSFVEIDYTRFAPRGFYSASEDLARYFQAVAWLQAIPLRVATDSELLAALIIGKTISPQSIQNLEKTLFIENQMLVFNHLVGAPDNWNLLDMAWYAPNERWLDGDALDLLRTRMREDPSGDSLINDQVRFPPETDDPVSERSFRVLSAHRTPDAIMFQRTTDPLTFGRSYPTGLEIAILLGSDFARERIEYADREKLLAEIDRARELLDSNSLYSQYLQCLAALFEVPDPAAPPFMSGEAWAAKNCQTALGGWSQLRHTWSLQAKQSVTYMGLTSALPGFVEPTPEFFARLGRLVRNTEILLRESGAFDRVELSLDVVVREVADKIELRIREMPSGEAGRALDLCSIPRFEAILTTHHDMVPKQDEWENARAFAARVVPLLRQQALDHATGARPIDPLLQHYLSIMEEPIERLWRRLSDLCLELEIVAHRQLRGIPPNERDRETLRGYGEQIAGIMLYAGNSYLTPRDDAPRAIDVHWNPETGAGLIVGTGRPRTLYVLYPTDAGLILCRGAVLPYYEFQSHRRLNDPEWKALLDSENRPPFPAWVAPIISGIGQRPPVDHLEDMEQ